LVNVLQEFAGGGDLWSFIDQNSGRLTERVTVSLVLQPFLRAVQYLHSAGIAHRCACCNCASLYNKPNNQNRTLRVCLSPLKLLA
jgi:hypothetical protein